MGIAARISGMMVMVIAVLTLIDIIGRATGIYTLIGVYEICMYVLVWLAFIGVAYAHKIGANIRVELVLNKLGPKANDILYIVALVIGIYVFGNILYSNIGFAHESYTTKEIISGIPTPVPFWPVKVAIPFGIFFLLVEFIIEIGQRIDHMRGVEI